METVADKSPMLGPYFMPLALKCSPLNWTSNCLPFGVTLTVLQEPNPAYCQYSPTGDDGALNDASVASTRPLLCVVLGAAGVTLSHAFAFNGAPARSHANAALL